eukprot:1586503-Amphidinium_carterae.1
MPRRLLRFIISKLFDFIWKLNIINRLIIISVCFTLYVYIKLPAQHVHHLQQFAPECSSASATALVFPSACGIPAIMSAAPAISGPQVTEAISIDHNTAPQQPAADGIHISVVTPRGQHYIAAGTSAPLQPDHGGESTHRWVPAGEFSAPIDPEATGWHSMPFTSTSSKMDQSTLLSKAASLAWSTHIMASGTCASGDHQSGQKSTTSSSQQISSYHLVEMIILLRCNKCSAVHQSKKFSVSIEHFIQFRSIWGSIMPSPFGSSVEAWLANHLVDYSIVSSSVYQYINFILELGDHTSIRQKLKYFLHNVFPSGIKELLMTSEEDWICYKNININLQHSAHLASKFAAAPSSSSSDSDVEEGPSKKIKPSVNDSVQHGTIMHFNKGAS